MDRRQILLTLASGLFVAGCGAPQTTSVSSSAASSGAIPQPQSGQGLVVLYRPYAAKGGALRFMLTLNGSSISSLANGTVVTQNVTPGQYTFVTSAPSVAGSSTVTTQVAAGQTVFIKGDTVLGYPTWRPRLVIVGEAQARSEIAAM